MSSTGHERERKPIPQLPANLRFEFASRPHEPVRIASLVLDRIYTGVLDREVPGYSIDRRIRAMLTFGYAVNLEAGVAVCRVAFDRRGFRAGSISGAE